MKSIVVYYSQTGSTRKIAGAIHAGMSELAEKSDIARIQDVKPADLAGYDLVGLGAPVWHRREPANVMEFIEFTMNDVEGKHGFAFCTHGLYPGRFFARVVPAMTQRGLTVIGWRDWYGSVFLPEKPKPYFTDGHPDEIDLAEAKDFGREMAARSLRIYAGETGLIPTLPRGKEYDALYPGPPRVLNRTARQRELIGIRGFDYHYNREKCAYPKCTVCIDNCPTRAINLEASPQILKETCDRCSYCEQICPRGAIEFDWKPIVKIVDEDAIRRFTEVSREAEANRGFRRLVPLEKVGWKTPWYKVKRPPRLKPI
ncbi:MAG TPA: flavodoxin domain-containing protein [Dehalococcoidales bacterium]|nr:flavodoxin domain-containing protein [Dehalococcoidales bacterium]